MALEAIEIWEYYDAPTDLQDAFSCDGDEEFLVKVPEHFIGGQKPDINGWPDLPWNIERIICRMSDTSHVVWSEDDGDWFATVCKS